MAEGMRAKMMKCAEMLRKVPDLERMFQRFDFDIGLII